MAFRDEKLNSSIDEYLKAFIKGEATVAEEHLEIASVIARTMIKKSGERVGIDTVEYYSKVSFEMAKKLFKARRTTEEISKIAAIDNFQECINKLEKAKLIFIEHEAIPDVQTNVSLLAKFLSRAGRIEDANQEIEIWLKSAEEKGYLFNKAQLIYQQAQIAVYQGSEQLGVQKALESLDICNRVGVESFTLYPLFLISQIQAEFGQSQLAFTKSLEGLSTSLKYNNLAFASQFFQCSGLASFGLNLPELAEASVKESVRVSKQGNLFVYLAVARTVLAVLLAEKGNFVEAKNLIEKARLEDTAKVSDPAARRQQIFRISGYEGKVYGLAKDFSKAEQCYKQSLQLAEELGYEKILGLYQTVQGLGESLLEQGKNEEALKVLLKARDMYTKAQLNLQVKGNNRLLDVNFSTRKIDEAIKLVQR